MSACSSNSTLRLLLLTEIWAAITQMILRCLMNLSFSTLGWPFTFDGPDHQMSAPLLLLLVLFLSLVWLFLLLSSHCYLFFVFASRTATVASKALLLSGFFLPFMSPIFFWSSYNCWHCAVDIESYSSLEYFFNSIFPLKVPWLVLVFCHLASLVWRGNVHALWWCFFAHIMGKKGDNCIKILPILVLVSPYWATAVDNLSHLMLLIR